MSFILRHMPKTYNELVFADQAVADMVREYAQGTRDKHLLLYGPAGSGKSIAARMIINTRLGELATSSFCEAINASNYDESDFERIARSWNALRAYGAERSFVLIDEVDHFSTKMLRKLRAFMDSTELGTIIATTNNLHVLDEPLKSRFRQLYVERPKIKDWMARAQSILAAEGYVLTAQEVAVLLKDFNGDARELIEWLEDYVLTFKSKGLVTQATVMPMLSLPASSKVLINGRPLGN